MPLIPPSKSELRSSRPREEAERGSAPTGSPYHRRPLIRHGDIEHAQLHPLGALIAIDRERSRDMQRLAAICRQRVAKLLADRAERDAVDDGAVAGFEPDTQMRLPH